MKDGGRTCEPVIRWWAVEVLSAGIITAHPQSGGAVNFVPPLQQYPTLPLGESGSNTSLILYPHPLWKATSAIHNDDQRQRLGEHSCQQTSCCSQNHTCRMAGSERAITPFRPIGRYFLPLSGWDPHGQRARDYRNDFSGVSDWETCEWGVYGCGGDYCFL